jgi:hypothetical protein
MVPECDPYINNSSVLIISESKSHTQAQLFL